MPTLIIIIMAIIVFGTIWGYESWIEAGKRAEIKDEIDKLHKEGQIVRDNYYNGSISTDEFRNRLSELNKKLEKLELKIKTKLKT